jgi:hypothetical protein
MQPPSVIRAPDPDAPAGAGRMKGGGMSPLRFATILLLVVLATVTSGCNPRGYFTDRWADAKDIFTASVGVGVGAKARVGPVHAGWILVYSEYYGLRCGEVGKFTSGATGEMEIMLVLGPFDEDWMCYLEKVERRGERDKSYEASSQIPCVTTHVAGSQAHYCTQIEVVAGLGGTLRLGFNPGELLDFLLGWTTLDLYGDDLEARRERERNGRGEKRSGQVSNSEGDRSGPGPE